MNNHDKTTVARFLKRKTPLGVIHKLYLDSVTVIDDEISNSNDSSMLSPLANNWNNIAVITLQQNSLTSDEFQRLTELIYHNSDLFATNMHDLVGTDVETMHNDTGDAKPVRKRAYRQSHEM